MEKFSIFASQIVAPLFFVSSSPLSSFAWDTRVGEFASQSANCCLSFFERNKRKRVTSKYCSSSWMGRRKKDWQKLHFQWIFKIFFEWAHNLQKVARKFFARIPPLKSRTAPISSQMLNEAQLTGETCLICREHLIRLYCLVCGIKTTCHSIPDQERFLKKAWSSPINFKKDKP